MKRDVAEAGWTIIELLIVMALIVIIASIVLFANWRRQIDRSYDSRRKQDLVKIRTAFEAYYNDKSCYPSAGALDNCDSDDLNPYLDKIPCDPQAKEAYYYFPQGDPCAGYRLCTYLKDPSDPSVISECQDEACPEAGYNYCLTVGILTTPPGWGVPLPSSTPTPSPYFTPTPSPTPSYAGPYACRPGVLMDGKVIVPGTCNNVGNPAEYGCPVSFAEIDCQNRCGDPLYWCAQ